MSAPKEQWATPEEVRAEMADMPDGAGFRPSEIAACYAERDALPIIPDTASQAIISAVVAAQTAQHNLQSTVGLVLATLGLSIETHDIGIEAGRAVVKAR